MPLIFLTIYLFLFSNAGELNTGPCTCWADTLSLSYVLISKYIYFFLFPLAALGLEPRTFQHFTA
jgi:hypothetical protein